MELKEYQKKALNQVKRYLGSLAEQREKSNKAREIGPNMAFQA